MTIDEFKQCDLRAGKVLSAERVEGSDKLLKLMIDLGVAEDGTPDVRQILSGIGKAYAPEDMTGKMVVIIANLDPRMMMGMESRGMLLAAGSAEGKPVILTTMGDVMPGARVT